MKLGWCYSPQNSTWMCLPILENLTFSTPIFLPNYPPISISFSKEKYPILSKVEKNKKKKKDICEFTNTCDTRILARGSHQA